MALHKWFLGQRRYKVETPHHWRWFLYGERSSYTRLPQIYQAPSIGFIPGHRDQSGWLVGSHCYLETVEWHRQTRTEGFNKHLFTGPAGEEGGKPRLRSQRQDLVGFGGCKKPSAHVLHLNPNAHNFCVATNSATACDCQER